MCKLEWSWWGQCWRLFANSCLSAPDHFSKFGCGEKQFQQKELFLFAGSIALCGFWNWRKRGNLKGEIVFPKHWFQFSLQNFPYWIQNMVADSSVSGVQPVMQVEQWHKLYCGWICAKWCLSYDNLLHVPSWDVSGVLCLLSDVWLEAFFSEAV